MVRGFKHFDLKVNIITLSSCINWIPLTTNIPGACLIRIISEVKPTEIYNLAAMSHVKISFQTAEYTADVDGIGTLRLLEAIRTVGINDKDFEKNVSNFQRNYMASFYFYLGM